MAKNQGKKYLNREKSGSNSSGKNADPKNYDPANSSPPSGGGMNITDRYSPANGEGPNDPTNSS